MRNSGKNKRNSSRLATARTGFALVLATVSVASCGPPAGPVDFAVGEHRCDHCEMGIADLRFRGEAITKKGRVYRFDSIECLGAWSAEHADEIHTRWVADFDRPGDWLAFRRALFLKSTTNRSPMGAGLSAHADAKARELAQERFGGRSLQDGELPAVIRAWRAQMSAAGGPR